MQLKQNLNLQHLKRNLEFEANAKDAYEELTTVPSKYEAANDEVKAYEELS
jgi:hypothetical protein